jgi:hypothetical protein
MGFVRVIVHTKQCDYAGTLYHGGRYHLASRCSNHLGMAAASTIVGVGSGAVGGGQGSVVKILGSKRAGFVGVAAVASCCGRRSTAALHSPRRGAEANDPPAVVAATPVSVATVEQRDVAL